MEQGSDPYSPHGDSEILSEEALAQAVEDAPQATVLLILYIQCRYHDSHREDLAQLISLAVQTEAGLGDNPHAARVGIELLSTFNVLLTAQMQRDERSFLPAMVSAAHPNLTLLIKRARAEHQTLRKLVVRLRNWTESLPSSIVGEPAGHALCFGMQEFTENLAAHLHLKDKILFPRFL